MLSLRSVRILPLYRQGPGEVSNLHTSSVLERRMGKRMRTIPLRKQLEFEKGPWWKKPDIIMTAPLAKTIHPPNQFIDFENKYLEESELAAKHDLPVDIEDPYKKEPKMCILCPRRYSENLVPSYKNPKLLSQFISPHTGRVYQSHITGLCTYMQELVEREVTRSHDAGLLSTKVRDPFYLQDPSLFNPTRPIKPNPY
jgi:small subunit ribosomal protein S18